MKSTRFAFILWCSAGWVAAQNPPAPEVGLDVNTQIDAVVARGWPLIIRASVTSVDGQPVNISLKSGSWTQALHLSITNQAGAALNWPVQLVPAAAPALSLSGIGNGRAFWLVSPSDTTAIADGTYNLSVTLDTTSTAASGSWAGSLKSNRATVQFEDEPASLTPTDVSHKYMAIAAYSRLHGDTQDALTALDTWMKLQPDDLEGYEEKGDLLAAAGDYAHALVLYQTALQKFAASNPDPQEPPTLLQVGQADLAARLAKQLVSVSASVHVTASGLVYSHASKEFTGTITVTNKGTAAISGPISVVITGLPSSVRLDNATGTLGLNGYPYIRVLSSGSLNKGQSATVTVRFANPSMGAIAFVPAPYSGI